MTQREIKELLEHAYAREQWKKLVSAIFPDRDVFARPVEHEATTVAGKKQVQHILQFGDVQLNDGNVVGLFEVSIAKGVDLSRNRVAIRKAIEQPVKQSGNSGALIAFVDNEQGLWRFSFYSNTLKDDGTWDANNPKRYTYLLGKDEKCLTAARQFETLAKKSEPVLLKDLLEAFSVEKVSKAFFREYKEHYQDFVEHLTGKRMVKEKGKWVEKKTGTPAENKLAVYFNGNEKDARDFCKKLMGRLVFLYFLQKKRWLGATGTHYQDGELDFVYRLFQAQPNKTFYPNVLVPLFFETLNAERPDDDYVMPDKTKRKVPFLNGGLFDMDALDEKTQVLTFPPELFSNLAKADEEKERGFLDFLNAYNFTVHEAGPEEQTLAVDPEMLGHIFENLLEDNKDKGAFYTPKEIVHYMCQESLVQYLKNYLVRHAAPSGVIPEAGRSKIAGPGHPETHKGAFNDPGSEAGMTTLEDRLRRFLQYGEWAELSPYSGLLLKALRAVKVCDPAIGSGAFPMGILHEIFQCVERIHDLSPDETESIWELSEWNPAEVKLRIIQHSIYGVDIERGAVDIARLRFWLSIIVDERAPRTLPNLDYKIVVGDSLLGRFNGELLEIDWTLRATTDRTSDIHRLIESLQAKTKLFFRDQPMERKEKLASQIRDLKIKLLVKQVELSRDKFRDRNPLPASLVDLTKAQQLEVQRIKHELAVFAETLDHLHGLLKHPNRALDYFDWQLDFPEVLNANVVSDPGFDIVVGNPPYIPLEELCEEDKNALRERYPYFSRKYETSAPFTILGLQLLRKGGWLAYITPQTWQTGENYSAFREHILERYGLVQIINLPFDVFEDPFVDTGIVLLCEQRTDGFLLCQYDKKAKLNELENPEFAQVYRHELLAPEFKVPLNDLASSIVRRALNNRQFALLGTLTKSTQGLARSRFLRVAPTNNISHFPFLEKARGQKYTITKDSVYLTDMSVHRNLIQYYDAVPRVMIRRIVGRDDRLSVAYCEERLVTSKDTNPFIPTDGRVSAKYLVGILASRLLSYLYTRLSSIALKDDFRQTTLAELRKLPIPLPAGDICQRLEDLVDRRMAGVTGDDASTALESEIDVLVCKLYGLSWEQAKVVDPQLALSKEAYEAIELPPADEPSGNGVSEPGVTGLTDEGTLFGQPLEEPAPKREKVQPAPSHGPASTAILQFLRANNGWHGKSAIVEGTGVDAGEWNTAIKELVDAGKVERQGEKKGAKYKVK